MAAPTYVIVIRVILVIFYSIGSTGGLLGGGGEAKAVVIDKEVTVDVFRCVFVIVVDGEGGEN